jgi:N-acetylmuramoyl-L-alanine amidase
VAASTIPATMPPATTAALTPNVRIPATTSVSGGAVSDSMGRSAYLAGDGNHRCHPSVELCERVRYALQIGLSVGPGQVRTLRTSTLLLACALVALAAVARAEAVPVRRPPVAWLKGEGNFTKAHRAPTSIDCIVVHVTEGAFWGSVRWLKSERSHASSHYVVSRRGRIVQLVHQSDIAWHAGNWRINADSVGIEHEGITEDPAGFTDRQYESSALLAAHIARTSLMPIDRRHLIGHAEVPDPDGSGIGGSSNHTDPGQFWNWGRYLKLVRRYAYPKPPVRLRVDASVPRVATGTVPWRARVRGPVKRVDFLVDGRLRWRDNRAPFAFAGGRGWRTLGLANGRHRLELRAYGPRGSWTRRRLLVRVRNARFLVRIAKLPATVAGVVPVAATVTGRARIVVLYLDGKRIDHDRSRPYRFAWDTRRTADGPHVLTVVARARDGRVERHTLRVGVVNAPEIVSSSIVEGAVLSGLVDWRVDTRGAVARVEFVVDGVVRATAVAAPYAFAWDTSGETPGPHAVVARAIGADGAAVESTATVVLAG